VCWFSNLHTVDTAVSVLLCEPCQDVSENTSLIHQPSADVDRIQFDNSAQHWVDDNHEPKNKSSSIADGGKSDGAAAPAVTSERLSKSLHSYLDIIDMSAHVCCGFSFIL